MAKSVRMADIAAKLGISIVSVSKGLAGKDGVSEEMRAKILATAQEMGYIPPAPKSAELARSENIGILVADRFFDENQFYSALYRAVLNRCTALGYSCLLELVGEEAEAGCIMPTLLTQKKVNGLIFMGEISRRRTSPIMALTRFGAASRSSARWRRSVQASSASVSR